MFNDDPDLFKKVITWRYGYDIETKAHGNTKKSQDWKKHVNFGQMWRFCSLFSSIAMAWCDHKVVRSIRNTTLKLSADCPKQFVRNAQNCGKTNHWLCTMITHQLTHRCLCLSFWQKQDRNYVSTTIFTGLYSRWLFPLPKTEDTDEM